MALRMAHACLRHKRHQQRMKTKDDFYQSKPLFHNQPQEETPAEERNNINQNNNPLMEEKKDEGQEHTNISTRRR
ncbi:uncharacterized protein LOC114456129 isoform X3 [Gouania willdenowi]|uniref:uncharacterized protein LOC114456129 isoform X3 n=1 Tax=Gouania willdenowi TaxID=441366 RepID=UPI00105451BE|nr:uncharacterized protein LOC114456129 isoform X3 [Gouania willdenowi]